MTTTFMRKIFGFTLFFTILLGIQHIATKWSDLEQAKRLQEALQSATSWWKPGAIQHAPHIAQKVIQDKNIKENIATGFDENTAPSLKDSSSENLVPSTQPYYTIQLSETQDREKAQKIVQQLRKSDVEAFATPVYRGTDVVYYIRFGLFEGEKLARTALEEIKPQTTLQGKIVSLP